MQRRNILSEQKTRTIESIKTPSILVRNHHPVLMMNMIKQLVYKDKLFFESGLEYFVFMLRDYGKKWKRGTAVPWNQSLGLNNR